MSIFVDKKTRLLVQGITGNEGLFHARQMMEYGTKVVAGVTPGKGGEWVLGDKVPVFELMPRGGRCYRSKCHRHFRAIAWRTGCHVRGG